MGLVLAQASAFPPAEEGRPQLVPIMETSVGGSFPPQALSPSLRPFCPSLMGEGEVGEALGVHVSPPSELQPVSGSLHISMREDIASGLKIGRCSTLSEGERKGGRTGAGRSPICFAD